MIKKQDLLSTLENQKEELKQFGRILFDCPEVGFRETKTAGLLLSFLEQHNIPCQGGLSLTGVRADIGDPGGSGYHIGLAADMDALYVGTENKKYTIHSCGHSIQTAVLAFAVKLVKESGLLDETGGSLSFIATPAEEFIDLEYRKSLIDAGKIRFCSGKQNMIADGVFDGLDCILSVHVNGEKDTRFDVGSSLTGFVKKRIIFTGRTAHSGALIHEGRNAMHGAALFLNALSFLKEQFHPAEGIKISPVITNCGGSLNAVPEQAVLETYVRANTLSGLKDACHLLDQCVCHCALALGLTGTVENENGYMPFQQSEPLTAVIYQNMLSFCPDELIIKNPVSGASGDIGDLGYLLPAVQFGFSGIRGRIHSADFAIADEENVYTNVARVILGSVYDLLTQPKLQVKNPGYESRKHTYMTEWLGC